MVRGSTIPGRRGTSAPAAPEVFDHSSSCMPHHSHRPHKLRLPFPDADPRLRRALGHRFRLEIFGYLMQKRGGSGTDEQELAEAFDADVRLVEYHLKVLHDADLIARLDQASGEAETEPSYVAAAAL